MTAFFCVIKNNHYICQRTNKSIEMETEVLIGSLAILWLIYMIARDLGINIFKPLFFLIIKFITLCKVSKEYRRRSLEETEELYKQLH